MKYLRAGETVDSIMYPVQLLIDHFLSVQKILSSQHEATAFLLTDWSTEIRTVLLEN